MKVIITNDSLDSLLSIQISTNGGQSYSTYSVSSLKDGLTFDCSSKDLKVICDVNTLKYIQVLADGEKAASNIDLNNYLPIRDYYFDFYKNPYYGKELSKEDISKLSFIESGLYNIKDHKYYCKFSGSVYTNIRYWSSSVKLEDGTDILYYLDDLDLSFGDGNDMYYPADDAENINTGTYFMVVKSSDDYLDSDAFYTDARVHFIKHF